MQALYALVFVLFSFAAAAQTLETWIAPYYLGDVDCFGEMNAAKADGVAIATHSKLEEDIPVGAVQPSDQTSTVKLSAGSDGELAIGDTIEQSATSTQPSVTEPTIEMLIEAKPDDANYAAIIAPTDAEDAPVEVIRLSKENSTVKYLIGSDSELAVGDTSEQSAMPARSVATKPTIENGESQIIEADDVAITGPNHSKDIVGAIEARGRSPIAAYSGQSNHQIDSE